MLSFPSSAVLPIEQVGRRSEPFAALRGEAVAINNGADIKQNEL
jgi:hypothetical protein